MVGRWFESGYGLGLEIDTRHDDPDLRWVTVGHVEKVGKRAPYYQLRLESGTGGRHQDIEAAKRELLKLAGVTVVMS